MPAPPPSPSPPPPPRFVRRAPCFWGGAGRHGGGRRPPRRPRPGPRPPLGALRPGSGAEPEAPEAAAATAVGSAGGSGDGGGRRLRPALPWPPGSGPLRCVWSGPVPDPPEPGRGERGEPKPSPCHAGPPRGRSLLILNARDLGRGGTPEDSAAPGDLAGCTASGNKLGVFGLVACAWGGEGEEVCLKRPDCVEPACKVKSETTGGIEACFVCVCPLESCFPCTCSGLNLIGLWRAHVCSQEGRPTRGAALPASPNCGDSLKFSPRTPLLLS